MPLTDSDRLTAVSDVPKGPPMQSVVLPPYPASIVKAFPEMEQHWRKMQEAFDRWTRGENVRTES